MDTHELAWAAGLYEGEGTIQAWQQGRRKYLNMLVYNCDKVMLERFQKAVLGLGIVAPEQRIFKKENWRDRYVWRATNFEEVQAVCALLWKYLSGNEKYEQVYEALKEVRDWNIAYPLKRRRVMEHGTTSMYGKGKCRCDPCTKAMKRYRLKRRYT